MVVDVPMLKRLFLIGCERLRAINWGSDDTQVAGNLQMICIDTRPGSSLPPSLDAQQKSFQLQVHTIITDARLTRSMYDPITLNEDSCYFNIKITSSAAATETKETLMVGSSSEQQRQVHYCVARGLLMYGDIFTKVGYGPTPMQAFPQAPIEQSHRHIEIGGGSHSVQSEAEDLDARNLGRLMHIYTESVHVHDVSTCSNTMPTGFWFSHMWCRVERCLNLHTVFPPGAIDYNDKMETIWASDLLKARCVWSKGDIATYDNHLKGLRHLHLRSCPSLRFALAMNLRPSFPGLETLHIIHCGDLRHVFVPNDEKSQRTRSVQFPKLTTIHLHDLPALQQICEGAETVAPMLDTIKIRGCPNLRRLPALKVGMKKPAVEVEKDVWDALEWDGVDAGHHPSLYETPVHSHFYKRRTLRRTILR